MSTQESLIPHLFRTEFSKIVSVLTRLFGLTHIEIAEDITSEAFLLAAETWGSKGIPDNPKAWLYAVAKNKTLDYIKRNQLFAKKINLAIQHELDSYSEMDIDLSEKNIIDSQLQMIFAICNPSIPVEAQIGLALRILCGFGIEEIANAFLTNKETINKRLFRAKEKLREERIAIEFPNPNQLINRLHNVLSTIYLLFNEGYYSQSSNKIISKDLCFEAMRLNLMLAENNLTNLPEVNALMALMCFHASRFEARIGNTGEIILYEDQDKNLWDSALILKGERFMNKAAKGNQISKYHLEAAIAYWHSQKNDSLQKWENILQLYNRLLQLEYSPIAALNRTYALSKSGNNKAAIFEALKLNLLNNYLFYSLLGTLYLQEDKILAIKNFEKALTLVTSEAERNIILKKIALAKTSKVNT
jgi:RNA polymerase sigma-70 factor (ECF subfamily)